ncbi:MAG: PQQ-binding-like beta-propeller repeat protein [Bacteroidales bacterium]|nr:PQQ-binding-like beta-propeller repeat protein [Bacteroidales bacterium]
MKRFFAAALALVLAFGATAQEKPIKFAFVTDTHFSFGSPSVEGLGKVVRDINSQDDLDFVVFGGDITDFGTDEEIAASKSVIDSLRYKYYIVAGNHDSKWSESGCNTFKEVFGYENFNFEFGGWRFLGCNCGPDMRMAPALLPRETSVWLKSLPAGEKTIFINHYPQDSSVLNYFDNVREMKRIGVRQVIGGHWHRNTILNYSGLPGVLGRSALASGNFPGYNIVTIKDDHITMQERRVFSHGSYVLFSPWYEKDLVEVKDTVSYDSHGLPADYPWTRYDVNDKYPGVKEVWKVNDNSNIVAGFAKDGDKAWYTTASGYVRCISLKNGRQLWTKQFPGKIFSTPAVCGRSLVFGCTDGRIYSVDSRSGKIFWAYKAEKSVVASPLIRDGKVFIGGSDGVFRCLDLATGRPVWEFKGVEGFVESTPYVDDGQVVFGSWGRTLYSLDARTGELQWTWKTPGSSRMYSPAACVPVKSCGRIFVAIPDRKVYALDARTGEYLFRVDGGREAIGLSEDGLNVYAKTMYSKAYKISAAVPAEKMDEKGQLSDSLKTWQVNDYTKYEISPTPIVEKNGIVFIPTDKGNLIALSAKDGSLLWMHKLSVALINPMQVWTSGDKTMALVSTMDGVVSLLEI